MEAGSASIATPKGLESEVMGLPWDVATHIEVTAVTDFTSCLPTCSTFTPSADVTVMAPGFALALLLLSPVMHWGVLINTNATFL